MLNSVQEDFLRGAIFGRDKNCVITADIADNLWPIAAIEGQSNALRCANGSPDDQQVRSGGLRAAQQICDGCHLLIAILLAARQLIAVAGLDGAESRADRG